MWSLRLKVPNVSALAAVAVRVIVPESVFEAVIQFTMLLEESLISYERPPHKSDPFDQPASVKIAMLEEPT